MKVVGFDCAAWGAVLRIEVAHDPLTAKVSETDRATLLCWQRRVQRLLSDLRNSFGMRQRYAPESEDRYQSGAGSKPILMHHTSLPLFLTVEELSGRAVPIVAGKEGNPVILTT